MVRNENLFYEEYPSKASPIYPNVKPAEKTSSQRNLEYGEAYLTYQRRVNEISKSGLEGNALDQALAEARRQYGDAIERIENPYKVYEQSNGKTR